MVHYYWYDAKNDEYCCVQCTRKVKIINGRPRPIIDVNPLIQHMFTMPGFGMSAEVDPDDGLDYDKINEELNKGE